MKTTKAIRATIVILSSILVLTIGATGNEVKRKEIGKTNVSPIILTSVFDRSVEVPQVAEVPQIMPQAPQAPSKPIAVVKATNTPVKASKPLRDELDANHDELRSSDKALLTKLVEAEARGESLKGKVAVVNVVLNRVNDKMYPSTIKDVIYQRGQFDPVSKGTLANVHPSAQSVEAVRQALAGRKVTNGALNFYNPKYAGSNWSRNRRVLVTIGNHLFTN